MNQVAGPDLKALFDFLLGTGKKCDYDIYNRMIQSNARLRRRSDGVILSVRGEYRYWGIEGFFSAALPLFSLVSSSVYGRNQLSIAGVPFRTSGLP